MMCPYNAYSDFLMIAGYHPYQTSIKSSTKRFKETAAASDKI
ncbi:hypothetical protein EVA_19791, partial [gut metagenome]